MIVSIEYDDGLPIDVSKAMTKNRSPLCTPRGRKRSFYVRFPDGTERRLPIGFMRVSEMQQLETVFNELTAHL